MRLRRLLALCAICMTLASTSAAAQVLLVLSDDSETYETVAAELRSGLNGSRAGDGRIDSVVAGRLDTVRADALADYRLVVTVGLSAAQATLARTEARADAPPTLCILIPRQSFEHLVEQHGGDRRVSALYIDQPLSRQLDLLRLALPERNRVGVVFGPTSQRLAAELAQEARARSLVVASAVIDAPGQLYGALQTVMPASDVLLLLPDPLVAGADTVYGLLLTTYRAQLPVAGFSAGLAKAGTLLSLYSTGVQMGRQAAQIATAALADHGALPAPQYPRDFTVQVNAGVARSLGLHVPSAEALTEALNARDPARAVPSAIKEAP